MFSKDKRSEISSWNLNIYENPNVLQEPGDQRVQISTAFENQDSGQLRECTATLCANYFLQDVGAVTFALSGISGTWTHMTVGAAPALAPLGIATLLGLLGVVGWRRLRA